MYLTNSITKLFHVPDDNEIKKTANAQTFCCVLLNLVALKVCVQFSLYMSLGMLLFYLKSHHIEILKSRHVDKYNMNK